MKKTIKKWILRFTVTGMFIAGLLLIIILIPFLTYAHHTKQGHYTIFHHKPLESALSIRLDHATQLLKNSEYYDPKLTLDICLNDGSKYSGLMKTIRGQAFAWGFYDKVVLMGKANYKENYVELNGYKWNLTQLIAHEMTHCYQFDKRGFWKSNPVAKIPNWKWEGYPEYVARQAIEQKDLAKNIDKLIQTERTNHNGWIQFADSTGTVIPYYKNWLLIQYCMLVKKMTYTEIINDTTQEETIRQQMMKWYKKQK
jgi:hypothetical protein